MKYILVIACLVTTACAPHSPDAYRGGEYVNNLVFVRHANGQCFGVVEFTTYAGYLGTSITAVPTELCK